VTELCKIGATYRTDKVIGGYTHFYHSLFANRRDLRKVLEVGIGTPGAMTHVEDYLPGASLFMWRDYFPQATVYGLDIDSDVLINAERIQSHIVDQRSDESLKVAAEWAGDSFDLIVDDGTHEEEHQLRTFQNLFPLVRPGGFYVIEDANDHTAISSKLTESLYPHQIVFCKFGALTGKLVLVSR
jgi:SAM-dependent methyltransferase